MNRLIRNSALLSILVWLCGFTAAAETVDLGEVQLGTVYNISDFVNVTGTFTAPSTGTLLQDGVADILIEGLNKTYIGYGSYGQVYSYQVTQGTTYNLKADFVLTGGKVCWTMEGSQALEMVSVDPPQGSSLTASVNYTGDVIVQFNSRVVCSGATLHVGAHTAVLPITGDNTNKLLVNVRDAMQAMYADGTLNIAGGDQIEIRLTGVQDPSGNKLNGSGDLKLRYTAGPKALALVSTNCVNCAPLRSYFAEGDPDGILTFTFDGRLKDDGQTFATLSCGNPESESTYYYEVITANIDGETATIDLTGKLRDINRYLVGVEPPYVALKISNVRDLKGNPAAGDGDGSGSSYNYYLTYQYIEPVTISSEFLPAMGSSLEGVDNIEIWFNNADMVRFDGVLFTCPDAEVIVPLESLDIQRDGNDMTINVAVPAQIKGKKEIKVSLYNLVSLDGYDHTRDICAVYDAWVVTLVSPLVDGGAYASTGADPLIFAVNKDYAFMRYDFYSGANQPVGDRLVYNDNGYYTATNYDCKMISGVDNYIIVSAWDTDTDYALGAEPLATYRFDFKGLTEPFSYSDVKFVGADPEPGTSIVLDDNHCFTLTFDGLVSISEDSHIVVATDQTAAFSLIEPVNPEETTGLSAVWRLYTPQSISAIETISIVVYAHDIDGKLVEGNHVNGEDDYLALTWTVAGSNGLHAIGITAADTYRVYSMSGVLLLDTTNAADLSALAKGLYIINGRKVMIK